MAKRKASKTGNVIKVPKLPRTIIYKGKRVTLTEAERRTGAKAS